MIRLKNDNEREVKEVEKKIFAARKLHSHDTFRLVSVDEHLVLSLSANAGFSFSRATCPVVDIRAIREVG